MSLMVVHDVTNPVTGSSVAVFPYKGSNLDSDTSITPFRDVLEEATSARVSGSAPAKSTREAVRVDKQAKSTGSDGTTKLDNIFKRASKRYNISYDFLVAVAKAESDFSYECVSSAGARGIMQLMPDEIREFGVTNPFDPEQNIMAAAKLLAAHLEKFKGDYSLAAAAYNAGSGRVQAAGRAIGKIGAVPDIAETQNYVKKINLYMKEGVKVPDKKASATVDYSSYENLNMGGDSTGSVGGAGSTDISTVGSTAGFDEGVQATDADWDQVRITVGTGDQAVTMTYGAYQKYKELGSLGVG